MRAASAICRSLPEAALPSVERIAGRAAGRMLTGRRRQVERNATRIFGPGLSEQAVDELVRETFTSYAHYWFESFRLPGMPVEAIAAGVTVTGFEAVTEALEAKRGLIVAMPHLGGWEWAGFWLSMAQRTQLTAVTEAVKPADVAEWFTSLRTSSGVEIVLLGPGAAAACTRALRANRVLCLVCDRDLAGDGVAVPFFGEETTLPGGPATLALRTGAPLVTAATYFDGRRHHFVVEQPLDTTRQGRLRDDVTRITRDVATRLEGLIRAAPEQWHMLQPNWPSDREAEAALEHSQT